MVYCDEQKNQRDDEADYFSWADADRRAGQGYLSPRRGGRGFCFAATVQDYRRDAAAIAEFFACHAIGDEAGLRKTAGENSQQAAGTQKWSSRQPSAAAGADRPARGTSFAMLSGVRRKVETLPSHAHTVYRGHSRGPQGGSCRAYNPSRLVSEMQKERRAGCARRPAALRFGQPRAGFDGLAALRLGQHALANHRSLQFSFAHKAHARRAGRSVAAIGGDFRSVVRTDSSGGPAIGGFACRRDQLAGRGRHALAVVFRGRRSYLFYDRPLPGQSGASEIFHSGIFGDFGKRLLGCLQQGALRGGSCAWCICCAIF